MPIIEPHVCACRIWNSALDVLIELIAPPQKALSLAQRVLWRKWMMLPLHASNYLPIAASKKTRNFNEPFSLSPH